MDLCRTSSNQKESFGLDCPKTDPEKNWTPELGAQCWLSQPPTPALIELDEDIIYY